LRRFLTTEPIDYLIHSWSPTTLSDGAGLDRSGSGGRRSDGLAPPVDSASLDVGRAQVVVHGLLGDTEGTTDANRRQLTGMHKSIHRHLGDAHERRHLGNGEKTNLGKGALGSTAHVSLLGRSCPGGLSCRRDATARPAGRHPEFSDWSLVASPGRGEGRSPEVRTRGLRRPPGPDAGRPRNASQGLLNPPDPTDRNPARTALPTVAGRLSCAPVRVDQGIR